MTSSLRSVQQGNQCWLSDPAFAVGGMVREHWTITGATMKSLSEITFESNSPEKSGSEALSAKHHPTKNVLSWYFAIPQNEQQTANSFRPSDE